MIGFLEGVSFIVLGGVAHASMRLNALPHAVGAVAQESLIVYFWHLCIVYGSPWNPGLRHFVPPLSPLQTVPVALAVIVVMVTLAWYWHWCKQAKPLLARVVMIATIIVLTARLL